MAERIIPGAAGDDAALMRRVEKNPGADLGGDAGNFVHGVREEVEATADADQLRSSLLCQRPQPVEIDSVAVGVDRCLVDLETVEPGTAGLVVGDVAADGGRRHDHGVARRAGGHEGVEIGHRTRCHADLGEAGAEHLGAELGGDDLDLLDGLQAHLVLVARIAQRRP